MHEQALPRQSTNCLFVDRVIMSAKTIDIQSKVACIDEPLVHQSVSDEKSNH
jgi:hypothetical protein